MASSLQRWELTEAEVKRGLEISTALGRARGKVEGKTEEGGDASG